MPSSTVDRRCRRSHFSTWLLIAACAGPGQGKGDDSATPDGRMPVVRQYEIDHPDSTGVLRSAADLVFLDTTRILLRDEQARRYLILGPTWQIMRSIGSPGDGPGEFRLPTRAVVLPGDSLLGADFTTGRVSVFGASGLLARSFSWPLSPLIGHSTLSTRTSSQYAPLGILSDGRLVLVSRETLAPAGTRLTLTVATGTPDGTPPTPRHEFPHVLPFSEGMARWGTVLYSSSSLLALRGDRLFIGTTDSAEIRSIDLVTGTEASIAHGLPLGPVTADAMAAEIRRRLSVPSPVPAFATEAEAMRRAAIERTPAAAVMPAFSGLVVDPEYRLWLTSCDPIDPAACTVRVLTSGGRRLGDFPLPRGFVLQDVGGDYLLGLTDDDARGRVIEVRAVPREIRSR